MLFLLPILLENIRSHFATYRITLKMRMDPILVSFAFHHVTIIDCSSSAGSDDFSGTISPLVPCRAIRLRDLRW